LFFGAFVDLGAGVMGLVHVSELSHTRVTRVGDAAKVGDVVVVKILKLDEKSQRISLSIRQATADPWSDLTEKFRPGQVYAGTLKRLTDFEPVNIRQTNVQQDQIRRLSPTFLQSLLSAASGYHVIPLRFKVDPEHF